MSTNVPIRVTGKGAKRVDIDELYDTTPPGSSVGNVSGKAVFLHSARSRHRLRVPADRRAGAAPAGTGAAWAGDWFCRLVRW